MPVLMIGEVPNLTEEIYAGMLERMEPLMRASKGFISHAGGPNPSGGWRVVEVWESQEAVDRFFQETLGQALQKANINIRPQVFQVHNIMQAR